MIDAARLADPRYFAENALPQRSDHRWFGNHEEIRLGQSRFETSLNGLWKFHYAPDLSSRPEDFEQPDFDVANWADIPVPAHIQLHGYDRPQYVNVQYPWDGHDPIWPGQLPRRNPVASYVTSFEAPELAVGERLIVRFDGAESAMALWLNGQWIGYATDSFTPSSFDLTAALVLGTNRLAVQVFRFSSASWIEDQDFFRFSGLFRDVTLLRLPATHLADIRITTELAADHSVATVRLAATVEGPGTIQARLQGVELVDGAVEVPNPQLWSAEDPHLYDLLIEVLDEAGNVTELVPQRVGIRSFGIEDGLLKINGKRVVFHGVNRHEFGPHGRVMTEAEIRNDLLLLKAHNINAIRTSHYPNSSCFYRLCDELGFYVIDEMNLESHGMMDAITQQRATLADMIPGDKPEWLPTLLYRAENMVNRDINHPSVVMWSCGNESMGGSTIAEVANWFRAHDSRPVHYESIYWDKRHPDTSDVHSRMYAPAAEVEAYLQEHRDKPYVLCEYAHSMGNSFGAVAKYTELAYREPLYQGGFIWDFADQALPARDSHGREFFAYGGDHQEAPHDGDFSGNGLLFADHTPKPLLAEAKHHYRSIVVDVDRDGFTVTNRFLFTRTSHYQCVVILARDGVEVERMAVDTDVAPGEQARYRLPFTVPEAAGEYAVTVSFQLATPTPWAGVGHEVAFGQGIFPVGQRVSRRCDRPEVIDGIQNIGVRGEQFQVLFSRLFGGLMSYRYGNVHDGGREWLRGMPHANFWHAPTSNERAWSMPERDGVWLLASRYARPEQTGPHWEWQGDRVQVSYSYRLQDGRCDITYLVDGRGRVQVDMHVIPGVGWPDAPECGLLMPVAPELTRLRWYGLGPHESYVDRCGSARLGIWEDDVTTMLTPYLRPQEAGNRMGVRWATVTDAHGRGLRLGTDTPMEFSALPWTPFEVENATHPHELPLTNRTVLRPALMRRGVAGDDTWGAMTHPEYRLPAGELRFSFWFEGI